MKSLLSHHCKRSLAALSTGLLRFCETFWARPRIALLILVVATVFFAGSMKKLRFLFSAEDMVGEGIMTADEIPGMRERYQDGTSSILLLLPPEGTYSFSASELCDIRSWYSALWASNPDIRNAFSTFDLKRPVRVHQTAVKNQNILQLDCEAKAALYAPSEVRETLNGAPWMGLKDSKERLSLFFAFTYEPTRAGKFGSFDPEAVRGIRSAVEDDLMKVVPGARAHWVGMADYQWYMKKGFQFAVLVNAMMVIFLIVAMRLCYGTWISGILYCSTTVIGGLWLYGGKAVLGSPYDLLSTGIFLIVSIGGLEDFTFLSSEQLKGTPWRKALGPMVVPSFFTSLTTVIGFASLCSSNLGIIRRFGSWCAMGAAFEWVMTFVFLPGFLFLFFKDKTWVNPSRVVIGRDLRRYTELSIPAWAARACLIVFPLTLWAGPRLSANDNPSLAFPRNHPYNLGLQELKETKGWKSTAFLLADPPLGQPPPLDALEPIAEKLVHDPVLNGNIVGYETAYQTLTWLARDHVLPDDSLKLGYRRSIHYQQLVDGSHVPRATIFLRDMSVRELQLLKEEVAKLCPHGECHVGGELIAYSDFATLVPETLIESMAISTVLVALVIAYLTLAFGKGRILPALLASSFWGPCLMLVFMVAFGIQMDFLKCIVASVLVGLTGDNAVQYLFAAGDSNLKSGVNERAGASIQTNLFMAITSLMYLASYFNPPKTFGLLLALGFVLALVGDLWLLNGLLRPKRPRAARA